MFWYDTGPVPCSVRSVFFLGTMAQPSGRTSSRTRPTLAELVLSQSGASPKWADGSPDWFRTDSSTVRWSSPIEVDTVQTVSYHSVRTTSDPGIDLIRSDIEPYQPARTSTALERATAVLERAGAGGSVSVRD